MIDHHAIVFTAPSLVAVAEQLPVTIADVDTDVISETALSITTVRSLIARAQQRPVASPVRSFVIETNQIPVIAQNALLKLFEDPPAHVRFMVVMPRPDELIATLRSRVLVIEAATSNEESSRTSPALLTEPIATQLATVERWVKEGEQGAIDEFLTATEEWLQYLAPEVKRRLVPVYLSVAARLRQPGASKKMLLEHLVLTLGAR